MSQDKIPGKAQYAMDCFNKEFYKLIWIFTLMSLFLNDISLKESMILQEVTKGQLILWNNKDEYFGQYVVTTNLIQL